MAAPKRELYKAADICDMAQLQPYVLRSWEAEFPRLGQLSASGIRIYGRADLDFVLRIKQLVFGEGLTLAGARRRLEEEAEAENPQELEELRGETSFSDAARHQLREIRNGLQGILALLARDSEQSADQVPPLELVAPSAEPSRPRGSRPGGPADRESTSDASGEKIAGPKRRRASA
jgi:DNA-binding transcriptional MerR regulator